jgi:hypothetical protein
MRKKAKPMINAKLQTGSTPPIFSVATEIVNMLKFHYSSKQNKEI